MPREQLDREQDAAAIGIRVVKAHVDAVLATFGRAGQFANPQEFAEAVALAVLAAEDHDDKQIKRVVVTQDPRGRITAYGPFPTEAAAQAAIAAGWCAYTANTRGMTLRLVPAPKAARRKAATKKTARTKKQQYLA